MPTPLAQTARPDVEMASVAREEDRSDSLSQNNSNDNKIDSDDDGDYRSSATFSYTIKNISQFTTDHNELSPATMVRNLPWKILSMVRFTANRDKGLAFFLQVNAESESTTWSVAAKATLRLISHKEGVANYERKIYHVFMSKENDWGFSHFIGFNDLLDPEKGYVKDNSITLEVFVNADAPHGVAWDSKKHTGYVGLKNQGATCYMNSLLQTLYFTNSLRKAVYGMPTDNDDPIKSVPLALQRVFYELQFSDKPVATKKLTKSFGWESLDSFMQHDVQELSRVLLDNLENKMKGSNVNNEIKRLFEGQMLSYIQCKHVDYVSDKTEAFYDIQLNIKNKKNVMESFKEYTTRETLEGDNKYDAGKYGLQEAEKGVKFIKFPPVLHLHLLRFMYDPSLDANVKVNDRYEFPEVLKLDEFLESPEPTPANYRLHAVLVHSGDNHGGHYVAYILCDGKWCKFDDDVVCRCVKQEAIDNNFGGNDEDGRPTSTNAYMLVYIRDSELANVLAPVSETDIPKSLRERLQEEKRLDAIRRQERNEAHLFLELVVVTSETFEGHQGYDLFDIEKGPRCARKFRVRKNETIRSVLRLIGASYGYDGSLSTANSIINSPQKVAKGGNAVVNVVDDDDDDSTQPSRDAQLNRQLATPITVNQPQISDDILFSRIRIWPFSMRQNRTQRPIYLEPAQFDTTVSTLHQNQSPEWTVFLELIDPEIILAQTAALGSKLLNSASGTVIKSIGSGSRLDSSSDYNIKNISPRDLKLPEYSFPMDVLIFLKLYDAANARIDYMGHLIVKKNDPVSSILPILRQRASFSQNTSLALYEEVQQNTINPIDNFDLTLSQAIQDLGDGDIVVFQKDYSPEYHRYPIPTPVHYFRELVYRCDILFIEKKSSSTNLTGTVDQSLNEGFTICMSVKTVFPVMAKSVGQKLGVDPEFIQFFRVQGYRDSNIFPVKSDYIGMIKDLLSGGFSAPGMGGRKNLKRIFYQIHKIPVNEIENKKAVKVLWTSLDLKEEKELTLYPDKNANVGEMLEQAKSVLLRLPSTNDSIGKSTTSPMDSPTTPVQPSSLQDKKLSSALQNNITTMPPTAASQPHDGDVDVTVAVNAGDAVPSMTINNEDDEQKQITPGEESTDMDVTPSKPIGSGKLRLLQIVNSKITCIHLPSFPVENLHTSTNVTGVSLTQILRIEEIPMNQVTINSNELLVPVAHFHKDPSATFGTPFLIKATHDDLFSRFKLDLQRQLGVSDKEFQTYKFATVISNRPEYITSDNQDFRLNLKQFKSMNQLNNLGHAWFGLEHMNKLPRRVAVSGSRTGYGALGIEKGVKIFN